ncbi:putative serine/threonine protein phosphatase 2A 59 kDa regulatory subunit B' eta isoform-like [Capsicum annuum]|nr:putative serine/threonine protein phosphatase 2A 59 kDa regulatory subunit B' eta isoform-like [Capsicum annuum]
MVNEDSIKSPHNPLKQPEAESANNGFNKVKDLFSPKFRSVAAMAGWDEEALLIASLVVEDTPDRLPKQKKRSDLLHFNTPPANSRRKRRVQKSSPAPITATVLDLDEDDTAKQESQKEEDESTSVEKLDKKGSDESEEQGCSVASSSKKIESKSIEKADKKGSDESEEQGCSVSSSSSAFPSIDRLREELSCAICLEICFEPSTTPCGHSFCKKCLRSAADKCGKKCPKCRQLISNGRSCTINTVLWNTIQLLFPKEVETRKTAAALNSREAKRQSPVRTAADAATHSNITSSRTTRVLLLNSPESSPSSQERRNIRAMRRQSARASGMPSRNRDISSRRELPSQDGDAALALRLQREEFMESFRTRSSADEQYMSSLALARANLRAMASRAINVRVRGSRGS